MIVKELTEKIADFGTRPYIYVQNRESIIGGGTPDEISERFGELKVCTFIAVNRGQIKIYVE